MIAAAILSLVNLVSVSSQKLPGRPRLGIICTGTPPDALLEVYLQNSEKLATSTANIAIDIRFAQGS